VDGRNVDGLPRHHLGRKAGQARDLGTDLDRGPVQHAERAYDRAGPSLGIVHEGDHTDFDDLVTAVGQASDLDVDHKHNALVRC
jgi:hypothetical protein